MGTLILKRLYDVQKERFKPKTATKANLELGRIGGGGGREAGGLDEKGSHANRRNCPEQSTP